MISYPQMDHKQIMNELTSLRERYDNFLGQKLSLDMTRGKPCKEQLNIASPMFENIHAEDVYSADGSDCRNYGVPFGITEAKELFASLLDIAADKVIVGNNSSLNVMFDTLTRALIFGECDSAEPWMNVKNRKWLCPVPGYDRHFLVTEKLGFELIAIPLHEDGPDMDLVERLVSEDPSIKGMWCMPLYSNPDGYVYSLQVCQRLASMKTAAKDFRILWDNAYVVHHLYEDKRGTLPDILALCEHAGNPNRVYEFASTSKITFAGAGISCMAANADNLVNAKKILTVQSIGPDKINQLRHARYLPNIDAVSEVMKKQARIIRPKFEKTCEILDNELRSTGVARWNEPLGGYFISLFVFPGTAKKVVAMAKAAGVALTPAGATYPYGMDPKDENIRIAPTFPSIADVEKAISVLCVCVKIAAAEERLLEAQL